MSTHVFITRVITVTQRVPIRHYGGMTSEAAAEWERTKGISDVVEELSVVDEESIVLTNIVTVEELA